MLSAEQLQQLLTENENLQVQLQELAAILTEREEELGLLRENAAELRELRSRFDGQLDYMQSMQNTIGEKQRQVEGAWDREAELQEELVDAGRLQQEYIDLVKDYAYIKSCLDDLQVQYQQIIERNLDLENIARKAVELESRLANTVIERDELQNLLKQYRNTP
jgi:predicted nuclease with TOPRIM domain